MKIAMLHPSLTWRGGAERQLLNLAVELQRQGHSVEVFTCSLNGRCYPEYLKQLIIHVIQVPILPLTQRQTQKRTIAKRLASRIRGYTTDLPAMMQLARCIPKGFDIINNHNYPTEWAAYLAKRRLHAPIVWMCNEPPFWFSDPKQRCGVGKINAPLLEGFDRIAMDYIDEIVVLSRIAGKRVENAYGRTSTVVRSGVNIELLHNADGEHIRRKLGFEDEFVMLQVGNIASDKRQSDSLCALQKLSKNHPKVKLVFDGEGPKEELVTLSRQLGVEDKVLFLHSCSDSKLAQVYAACDVFVFPAQITWGLAVIEAMAASKPVVVSRKSGASEVIESGVNGFVFDEPNPQNMAAQIEKLITDENLRRRIGANAYQYTKQNLSWATYAKNMAAVFQNAIDHFK